MVGFAFLLATLPLAVTEQPHQTASASWQRQRRLRGSAQAAYHLGAYHTSYDQAPLSFENLHAWSINGGSFANPFSAIPPPDLTGLDRGSGNYVVVGGEGVQGVPTASQIMQYMDDRNYQNVDFDMEGDLDPPLGYEIALQRRAEISQARPQARFQITVLAGFRSEGEEMPWLVKNHQQFNLITLMLYGASMEGFGWGIPCENPRSGPTYNFIRRWRNSGIPVHKMVLGMTTTGLQGHMVDFYKELVLKEGWAGITFWNWAGLSAATEVNEACIVNPAQRCNIGCSPPSPPSGTINLTKDVSR